MSAEIAVAGVLICAVIAYGVLGGADFGGGIWNALATGPRRNEQRRAIDRAMGPVWEANHVWLIFVVVLLFTAFPSVYAALGVALFVPFHLVLVGITLRGAAFVFRGYSVDADDAAQRSWGARFGVVFAASSVITPLLLGMCLGSVASGDLRVYAEHGLEVVWTVPWLSPVAIMVGLLALATCAYLAAVYLANETRGALREDFRRRALVSGGVVVALSIVALPVLASFAPHLWTGLISARAAPILALGATSALASGWLLLRRRFRAARVVTVIQVVGLIGGFGVAQYPFLVYPDLILEEVAAPRATLQFVLWSTLFGMALLVPSLWLLFRVFQREPTQRA